MTASQPDGPVHLSVVAPAFNEAECLPVLIDEIADALANLARPWEIVIADDQSEDATAEVLRAHRERVPQLRVVTMAKRSGQSAALDAALRAARGKFIATLDADLQNDPADIPKLLAMVESGRCDLVNGWRVNRQDSGMRRISSKLGNALRNFLTRETIHDSGCGLKVFRAECVSRMKVFNGYHRFFATLVRMDGHTILEEPVNHRPRTMGVAKYGFWNRFFRVIRDALAVRWMQNRSVLYDATEEDVSDDV